MTKYGVISAAGTVYPSGIIAPGGGSVDEIEIFRAPLDRALFPVVYVASTATALGTVVVTVETATEVTFATPTTRVQMGTITVPGKSVGTGLAGGPDLYARFKATITSAATPNWGTPVFTLTPNPDTLFNV